MPTRASREERIEAARQIIRKNPEFGKDRINLQLRERYGMGLRRIYVAELKYEILFAKPTRIEKRYQTLTREGFLPSEARVLAINPITAKAMRAYRAERRMIVRESAKADMPKREVTKQIRLSYRVEGHAPKGKIQPLPRYRDFLKRREMPPEAEKAPPKPALSLTQQRVYKHLRDSSFSAREAHILVTASGLARAINSDPWRNAISERREWVRSMLNQGWTIAQIRREVEDYYKRDPKRSPFDFVREYIVKGAKVKDFLPAAKRRAQIMESRRKVRGLYGLRRRRAFVP